MIHSLLLKKYFGASENRKWRQVFREGSFLS